MKLTKTAETEADLRRCFPVMVQLRPHLSQDEFVARALRQSERDGYVIAYVEEDGEVRAVAGYRISECMHAGKFLYVDDLVTDEKHRSKNHGDTLFDWLVATAKQAGCVEFSLDSGVQRHDAHRFYFRKKMRISGHHFSLNLT
jgi:GNAT superfamily N-acetyltransferase